MGHLGTERVLNFARQRFFWPRMHADIEHFIQKVCRCVKQRRPVFQARAPLQPIVTTCPLEMISIDFLHLERSKGGYEYILVIVDHFTRFAQVYATRNKSAKTVASKLYNDFILRFGFPSKIHDDQGAKFENNLFDNLQKLCDIKHSRTTPYHPQGNRQVERCNCTLIAMLRTLPESYKCSWNEHLNKVTHAYNCTRNNATGFSPFYLLFGRHHRLPIDIVFNIGHHSPVHSYNDYIHKWKTAIEEAYGIGSRRSCAVGARNKTCYDLKTNSVDLQPNDRVLVRNLSERGGPGKLRSHWEKDVHRVIRRKDKMSPVYEVQCENGKGPVLHRNLLLQSNDFFIDLKKAFDTVDHQILLDKMQFYGLTGNAHTWFSSYLDNRKQYCRVNGTTSSIENIDIGVPQGSCLGPLLFLLYINDLPFALKKAKATMYADDTAVSYSSDTSDELDLVINEELSCIEKWLQGNRLSLNVVKTQAMIIGSKPKIKKLKNNPSTLPSFKVGGEEIDLINETKYLGVVIDNCLTCESHISALQKKISRAIGLLNYARNFVQPSTLINLYRSIIEPHFSNWCSVLGS